MAKKQAPLAVNPASFGGEAEMVDGLPSVGVKQAARDAVPLGEINEPWYWVASPLAWQVLEGQIVPSLRKIILHRGGGIGNVDTIVRNGVAQAEPSLAISRAQLKGETVLDFYDPKTYVTLPDGRKVPYIRKVKATGGWISQFETVFGGTDAVMTDSVAYATWLTGLIEDGVIPPAPIYQLRRLQQVIGQQITQYRDRGGQKAAYGSRVAKLERDLKVVEAALRERVTGGAPAETDDGLPEIPKKGGEATP